MQAEFPEIFLAKCMNPLKSSLNKQIKMYIGVMLATHVMKNQTIALFDSPGRIGPLSSLMYGCTRIRQRHRTMAFPIKKKPKISFCLGSSLKVFVPRIRNCGQHIADTKIKNPSQLMFMTKYPIDSILILLIVLLEEREREKKKK